MGPGTASASAATLLCGFRLGSASGGHHEGSEAAGERGGVPGPAVLLQPGNPLPPPLLPARCAHSLQLPLTPGWLTSPAGPCNPAGSSSDNPSIAPVAKHTPGRPPARAAARGAGWHHSPALCGPGRPPGTASASHRCWSREAPGLACTWGSNPPGGSGQSFSRSGC